MELGAFSISLAVKDVAVSRDFYAKLGFVDVMGDGESWQIIRNGSHTIGLFAGVLDRNTLTFNPGWDSVANELDSFTDIRAIQRLLKGQGVEFASEADENATGPGSFVIIDPDGNPILFDQHVG